MFFIIEKAKETILGFSEGTVQVLQYSNIIMTQYNTLNVKLSNSQLNTLKSRIKNNIDVTLKISSNVVGDSNDEYNFLINCY